MADEFNSYVGSGRTSKMLRSKWDSLKKVSKKKWAQKRAEIYKTGGGPTPDIKIDVVTEKILDIIAVGGKGTENDFDCDRTSNCILHILIILYITLL